MRLAWGRRGSGEVAKLPLSRTQSLSCQGIVSPEQLRHRGRLAWRSCHSCLRAAKPRRPCSRWSPLRAASSSSSFRVSALMAQSLFPDTATPPEHSQPWRGFFLVAGCCVGDVPLKRNANGRKTLHDPGGFRSRATLRVPGESSSGVSGQREQAAYPASLRARLGKPIPCCQSMSPSAS